MTRETALLVQVQPGSHRDLARLAEWAVLQAGKLLEFDNLSETSKSHQPIRSIMDSKPKHLKLQPRILQWLALLLDRGLDMGFLGAGEQLRLADRVLGLHASLESSEQQETATAAVSIALHLIQPAIAASFGASGSCRSLAERFELRQWTEHGGEDDYYERGGLGGFLSSRWKFLLGNTLLRMLAAAGLPALGAPSSSWPPECVNTG